jgi:hypothetical protein
MVLVPKFVGEFGKMGPYSKEDIRLDRTSYNKAQSHYEVDR